MSEKVRAYNLHYSEEGKDALSTKPKGSGKFVAPPVTLSACNVSGGELVWGWSGGYGPGIDPKAWPRSPLSRLPMRHVITLRLPEEYQRKGAQFPGIAYFMGDGQFANETEPIGDDDPFFADLETTYDHPQLLRREDIIGQQFALIWLTEEEISAGPTPPPTDTRRPDEHNDDGEGRHAWDGHTTWGRSITPDNGEIYWVWLIERVGDVNAGIAPVDTLFDEDAKYVCPFDEDEKEKFEGVDLVYDHLGGTTYAGAGSSLPDGMTPYYLELDEPIQTCTYGNHETHLIDLESDAFDIC